MKQYLIAAVVASAALLASPLAASANHSTYQTEATQAVTAEAAHTASVVATHPDMGTCEFEENLGQGAKGEAVHCLQYELIEAGYLPTLDVPTGNFGALTVEALKKWQTAHGVPATGYFGPLTRAALHSAVHAAMGVSDDHHDATSTASETAHTHAALDVSGWAQIPSVSVVVHEDTMGGYNLEVTPVNFTFAPQHVNGAVVPGEGHAHLYINGVKYTRLYGQWIYLPVSAFTKGENTVRVTLNANNHSDLAVGQKLVEASATFVVK